jgi:hypothetical protein
MLPPLSAMRILCSLLNPVGILRSFRLEGRESYTPPSDVQTPLRGARDYYSIIMI